MMNVKLRYGKDTSDLIDMIVKYLSNYIAHNSFNGIYAKEAKFSMTPISHIGVFTIQFPDALPVAIAGINMETGDYIYKTTEFDDKQLVIYGHPNLKIGRLISRAEYEWSIR